MEAFVGAMEAAKRLGVARGYLNQLVAQGKLEPTSRTPGGHMRFDPAYLEEMRARFKARRCSPKLQAHCERIAKSAQSPSS